MKTITAMAIDALFNIVHLLLLMLCLLGSAHDSIATVADRTRRERKQGWGPGRPRRQLLAARVHIPSGMFEVGRLRDPILERLSPLFAGLSSMLAGRREGWRSGAEYNGCCGRKKYDPVQHGCDSGLRG